MFIKRLTISSLDGVLRDIMFHAGLNLIVDTTPDEGSSKATGNNVGKTTVLRLIDYCLAGKRNLVYADPEHRSAVYSMVFEYLKDRRVEVELELVDSLEAVNPSRRVVIRRNFLSGIKDALREVDGFQVAEKDLCDVLTSKLFPSLSHYSKPTFRQVIGHNIRIDDYQLNRTLKFLNQNTKNVEYESLFLYMFGCPAKDAGKKQRLVEERRIEQTYLKRLRAGMSESDYEAAREALRREIAELEERRRRFESSPTLLKDMTELDGIAVEASRQRSRLSQVDVRIGLINEARASLDAARSQVDVDWLRGLYDSVSGLVPSLQRSFEELLLFHNDMLEERKSFISTDLSALEKKKSDITARLEKLARRERDLSSRLAGVMTSEEFEELIVQINERYRQVGEYDDRLKQLGESKGRLERVDAELRRIEDETEGQFEHELQRKVDLFNRYFSKVSQDLYGESYIIAFDKREDKHGAEYFDFHTVDVSNVSSGKKQGEILCFDIAYTRFADEEGIDCLHFILNDKKELVHGNQLSKIAELSRDYGVQVVISMLRDKLPRSLDCSEYVILSLSQDDKLFRIERH